tara:strand:- start:2534 stop:3109 length:576 start_codon:yes stop_codon:yes gene_type:complete
MSEFLSLKTIYIYINFIKKLFSKWGFTWAGIFNNRNGEWQLFIQIIVLSMHLLPGYPIISKLNISLIKYTSIISIICLSIGISLAIKALFELGSSLSPLPEPIKDSELITKGIYSFCRHPLYQSLIIISISLSIYKISLFHIILLIILCKVLKIKALREEKSLKLIHPQYKDYMKKTPSIIPGISYLDWRV